MKRIKILLQVFLVTLLVLSCTKNEEVVKSNKVSELSMDYINSVVNSRIEYLNDMTLEEYNNLITSKKSENINTNGIESFFIDSKFVTEEIEKKYEYFWLKIADLSTNQNIELINSYINNSINETELSNNLTLEQKEVLLIEYITAKKFINNAYKNYTQEKSNLFPKNIKNSANKGGGFWCGLSIAGNAVATVGLVSCIGTAGLGCAAAVAGKVISFVSIFGSC